MATFWATTRTVVLANDEDLGGRTSTECAGGVDGASGQLWHGFTYGFNYSYNYKKPIIKWA